jgi:hypothetical protein
MISNSISIQGIKYGEESMKELEERSWLKKDVRMALFRN